MENASPCSMLTLIQTNSKTKAELRRTDLYCFQQQKGCLKVHFQLLIGNRRFLQFFQRFFNVKQFCAYLKQNKA
jgi:hypothetical protein